MNEAKTNLKASEFSNDKADAAVFLFDAAPLKLDTATSKRKIAPSE